MNYQLQFNYFVHAPFLCLSAAIDHYMYEYVCLCPCGCMHSRYAVYFFSVCWCMCVCQSALIDLAISNVHRRSNICAQNTIMHSPHSCLFDACPHINTRAPPQHKIKLCAVSEQQIRRIEMCFSFYLCKISCHAIVYCMQFILALYGSSASLSVPNYLTTLLLHCLCSLCQFASSAINNKRSISASAATTNTNNTHILNGFVHTEFVFVSVLSP